MFSPTLLLCLCYLLGDSYANPVSFIHKCEWNNEACLKSSTQDALQHFRSGIPEIGILPLDPLVAGNIDMNEAGLKMLFKDTSVYGLSNCKILYVKRNLDKNTLELNAECPVYVNGTYEALGDILLSPISGNGAFSVKSGKVFLSLKVGVSYVDGKDGQKHLKIGKTDYQFEFKDKAFLVFENLFDGDKEKSEAIHKLFDQNWKEIVTTFGNHIIGKMISSVMPIFHTLTKKIPSSDLEIVS